MRAARVFSVVLLLTASLAGRCADSDAAAQNTISGQVTVNEALADQLASDDRLVLRIYYPHEGVDKDETFRIADSFSLPLEFQIGPALDMSRRTKWRAYMVEVYTDKDADVMSRVAGELSAHSQGLVPLGTTGLKLELNE